MATPRKNVISLGLVFGIGFCLALLASQVNWNKWFYPLNNFVYASELDYQRWFNAQNFSEPMVLFPIAFVGGLLASISPCILALLPLNLSYIGTREVTSRWDAFAKATAFVLGVVTVLSLLGLFSSLAGMILIQFRGYIHFTIGILILLMALSLLEVIRLPLPQFQLGGVRKPDPDQPRSWTWELIGSYSVGLTFAMLSSPCSSPLLFTVLAAATGTGSQLLGSLTMVSYSLGYTALIFMASVFTGLAKQAHALLNYSQRIIQVSSIALLMLGLYYMVTGGRWIVAALL